MFRATINTIPDSHVGHSVVMNDAACPTSAPGTLIAPESLQQHSQARLEYPGVAQAPNTGKTFLDFSKDKVPGTTSIGATLRPPGVGVRMPSSRSVFGVDEIWEREMAAAGV
jgi:hypothetical protein